MSDDAVLQIGADGIDVDAVVADIRKTVAEKLALGAYTDARVARAERTNLELLKDEEHFLPFYLGCLREAVFVDINDFDIQERRGAFANLFIVFKRLVWKTLKFYTYRLWSQQNQVNGLLLSAVEGVESRYREKLALLETRIAELESKEKKG